MGAIFIHEVKYYIKNTKELIQIYGLFLSVILLYFFSHAAGELKNQALASSMLWIALTMAIALGSGHLFQRDHDSGRLEYYQMSKASLSGVILAKWMAYFLFITIPLVAILPVIALLVDIPVGALPHYLIGLVSGAIALSLLSTLMSAVMAGLEKVGALLAIIMLPLSIPVIIFGTSYLMNSEELFQSQLLFLWGFSLILLPITCIAGTSCIRAAN